MKPYGSVDEAFKDEKFLRYLADNNRGLGLTEEQIKSFYSGRDGKGNATHEEINEKIERIVAEAASTVSVK